MPVNLTITIPDDLLARIDAFREPRFLPRGTAVKQLLGTHPDLLAVPAPAPPPLPPTRSTLADMVEALYAAGYDVVSRRNPAKPPTGT